MTMRIKLTETKLLEALDVCLQSLFFIQEDHLQKIVGDSLSSLLSPIANVVKKEIEQTL